MIDFLSSIKTSCVKANSLSGTTVCGINICTSSMASSSILCATSCVKSPYLSACTATIYDSINIHKNNINIGLGQLFSSCDYGMYGINDNAIAMFDETNARYFYGAGCLWVNYSANTTCVSGTLDAGGIKVRNGCNINLIAASSSTDSGDIIFFSGNSTGASSEIGRIWMDTNTQCFQVRNQKGSCAAYKLINENNINQFATSWVGNTANAVGTYINCGCICANPNITHDGTTFTIKGKLSVSPISCVVSSNSTNYLINTSLNDNSYKIASGVVDSGYRLTLDTPALIGDSCFCGTLNNLYGLRLQYGHYTGSGAGTICSAYGIYLSGFETGSATINNKYGIYQSGANFINCFSGAIYGSSACFSAGIDSATCVVAGTNIYYRTGAARCLAFPSASATGGYALYVLGQDGCANNNGGVVYICGGNGGAGTSGGGAVYVIGGNGATTGGQLNLQGGNGINGGDVNIIAGCGSSTCANINMCVFNSSVANYAIRAIPASCVVLYYAGTAKLCTVTNGICLGTNCGFGTDFVATSDCRLKKDVLPISNALSIVTQLQGVCYHLCDDEKCENRIGLIAQDVQDILPEIVTYDSPGKDDEKYGIFDKKLGLKYDKLTAVLIEAIKEQQLQIDNLRNELNELKNFE